MQALSLMASCLKGIPCNRTAAGEKRRCQSSSVLPEANARPWVPAGRRRWPWALATSEERQ